MKLVASGQNLLKTREAKACGGSARDLALRAIRALSAAVFALALIGISGARLSFGQAGGGQQNGQAQQAQGAQATGAAGQETGPAETALRSLVSLEGASPVQATGFGLVVGLDGSGDRVRGRRGASYTVQGIANMLREFGVRVEPELLESRNAAAVMVTATIDPFSKAGRKVDVTVSSMGDARSLSGGVLLRTPLQGPSLQGTGKVQYAVAQGPLTTGSAQASSQGTSVRVNFPNTGRIPNGGIVKRAPQVSLSQQEVGLVLDRPDFTNASSIAEAINAEFDGAAEVTDAGKVTVEVPDPLSSASQLMAALEGITVEAQSPARVVINERTGTVVAGGDVTINEVLVTYGGITVSTREDRFVSQPNPLGQGETQPFSQGSAEIQQRGARSVVLPPRTNVSELASALNELGVTARDIISIFQSIDRAGALQGKLVVL